MVFNNHRLPAGAHAPFPASKSSWLRYTEERALEVYKNSQAATRGTRVHAWAAEAINLGIKQAKTKSSLNKYINDAIGYVMDTEVVLYYSDKFFGTADAICFRSGLLRIHDLKTGTSGNAEEHIDQLKVYCALFCLEYHIRPDEIDYEVRVYKMDEVLVCQPTAQEIAEIMDIIVNFDKLLTRYDNGEI